MPQSQKPIVKEADGGVVGYDLSERLLSHELRMLAAENEQLPSKTLVLAAVADHAHRFFHGFDDVPCVYVWLRPAAAVFAEQEVPFAHCLPVRRSQLARANFQMNSRELVRNELLDQRGTPAREQPLGAVFPLFPEPFSLGVAVIFGHMLRHEAPPETITVCGYIAKHRIEPREHFERGITGVTEAVAAVDCRTDMAWSMVPPAAIAALPPASCCCRIAARTVPCIF